MNDCGKMFSCLTVRVTCQGGVRRTDESGLYYAVVILSRVGRGEALCWAPCSGRQLPR